MTETVVAFRPPEGPSVCVHCESEATTRWLCEMLTPWFELLEPVAGDMTVRVHESPREEGLGTGPRVTVPCFALDRTMASGQARAVEGSLLVDDHAIGASYDITPTDVVVRPMGPRPSVRLGAFFAVRELLVAGVAPGAGAQLHASAVTFEGNVILLAGPKRSGKTTTLVHLAGSVGAGIVANDRTLVQPGSDSWSVRGVPTIVSLRPGTVAALPHLLAPVEARGRTIHLTLAEAARAPAAARARVPGRELAVSLAQLGHRLGAPLVAGGRVGTIAFLAVDRDVDTFAVRSLTAGQARDRLADARYGAATEPRPLTVFETRVGRELVPGGDARLLGALGRDIACLDVRVGPGLLTSGAAAADLVATLAGRT
ncbi:MAG: hypothetical protein V7605_1880 [Acidimicrobiaceae bacterium]